MFSFASLGKLPFESATDTSITDGSADSFFITVCSFSSTSLVTLSEDFTSPTTFSRLISDLSSFVNISLASSLLIATVSSLLGTDAASSKLTSIGASSSSFATLATFSTFKLPDANSLPSETCSPILTVSTSSTGLAATFSSCGAISEPLAGGGMDCSLGWGGAGSLLDDFLTPQAFSTGGGVA